MSWQDISITVIQVVFSVSLLPQIYYGYKEKVGSITYLTSVPTFLGMYVMCGTYISLSLYFSAITSCIVATLWLILSLQRKIYHTKKTYHQK